MLLEGLAWTDRNAAGALKRVPRCPPGMNRKYFCFSRHKLATMRRERFRKRWQRPSRSHYLPVGFGRKSLRESERSGSAEPNVRSGTSEHLETEVGHWSMAPVVGTPVYLFGTWPPRIYSEDSSTLSSGGNARFKVIGIPRSHRP